MPAKKAAPPIVDEPMPGLENLRQDPAPGKRRPGRPAGSTTKKATTRRVGDSPEKAQLKADVHAEIYGLSALFIGVWGMRDECAQVFLEPVNVPGGGTKERLEALVDRVVALISRSDKLLGVLAKGGIIAEVGMTASLLFPVVQQIWQAHGPNGHGHREEETHDYAQRFPAPALA